MKGKIRVRSRRTLAWSLATALLATTAWAAARAGTSQPDRGIASLEQTGHAFASIAKKASPGVVFIRVDKTVHYAPTQFGFDDDFLRRFFGAPFGNGNGNGNGNGGAQHLVGQGSGFIISKDGYVLTNSHVVGDADKVTVTLQDGRVFNAKKIASDSRSDVAVVKIDGDHLTALPLGDSDSLVAGEWVVAVGNPFGLSHTVTAGIVSAVGRSSVGIADYEDFIQTDAAINPGNSGGPLIDLEGKVVGMNTAIVSGAGGNVGVGFAIPINMAKTISDQLIAKGSVTRGHLGVIVQDLTPDLAASFGLEAHDGVVVSQVLDDSPAAKAGLRRSDVILELDGKAVTGGVDLRNDVAMTAPGKKVRLTVQRDGKKRTIDVTIAPLPEQESVASAAEEGSMDNLGLSVQDLTPELAQRLGVSEKSGVVVTGVEAGSAADLAGMRAGEVILEANRHPVNNTGELEKALARSKNDDTVLLLLKDRDYSRFVVLKAG